jgi:HSP20 family molecular chaperone IbpA
MNTQLDKRPERAEAVQQRPAIAPRVDIFENRDELLVLADMPGVTQNGLSIHLDEEQLRI